MRLAPVLTAALAACTPAVTGSSVEVVDAAGRPISSLAVPTEPIGGTTVLTIVIVNVGGAPSPPLALALSGTVAADFTRDAGCAGVALERGMRCQVQLFFQAAHEGKLTASLDITADELTHLELDTDVFKPAP